MQPFVFHSPTNISFGEDTICGIGDMLRTLGGSKPLLVTDANLIKAGVVKGAMTSLAEAGMQVPVFDDVPADSDLDCVRRAVALGRGQQCDCVVAIGGGSVIDSAKVANIGLSFDGDLLEFEGINTLPRRLLPMIAVPTTAGTGSEVSAVAMIKDVANTKKLVFGSRFLAPDAAILDPTLLRSLPPKLTAATGLDALTHALESYVAATANPASSALCLEAMRLLFESLPDATGNGGNMEARSSTLVGSMIAGMAFTNAGVGIVHALAHSVGAQYGTHHGMTNTVFLPAGMRFNAPAAANQYAQCYWYLHLCLAGSSCKAAQWFASDAEGDAEAATKKLIAAVESLISCVNLPTKLSQLGVPVISEEDLQHLAETALNDPAMMFNPNPVSIPDLVQIIKGAY
jgi:alcohol dehydrogenase class IV